MIKTLKHSLSHSITFLLHDKAVNLIQTLEKLYREILRHCGTVSKKNRSEEAEGDHEKNKRMC